MKKVFLLAATLMATAVTNAQQVTPLSPLSTQYQMDSMRIVYANNAAGMVSELTMLQETLEQDTKMLKDAEKLFKDENTYLKVQSKYIKTAQNSLNSMEKGCNAELKSLQQLRDAAEDGLSGMQKLSAITDEYKNATEQSLRLQINDANNAVNAINDRLNSITKQRQDLTALQNTMATYDQTLKTKGENLKNMQAQHKANKDAVKSEMKAAKAAAKAQKK